MKLVIHTANCVGNTKNCSYPNRMEISSEEELLEAVKQDHVCGEYKNNYRNVSNFVKSNVVVMDCDNDHSDDPAEWITAKKIDELMPDIAYAIAPSRHNMLQKDKQSARPRFHIYFLVEEITDAESYSSLKVAIQKAYPFFDSNALDAARFIFGAECDEVVWHDGWLTIDTEVEPLFEEEAEEEEQVSTGPILEGSRNNTMSRFAGRILKRYGNTEKAHVSFLEFAQKCDPPLDDEELSTIWNSAVKFYKKKVVTQDGYVEPDEYNSDFDSESLKPEDYSDIGEAKVLVREYGEEIKYSAATDFIRYDGKCWQEDAQLAIGAIEEFLDLQLCDAQDEKSIAEKALLDAGIPDDVIKAGTKAIQKAINPSQMGLLYQFMAAEAYLKFVLKRRDYKYIVSTGNAAKPMIAVDVNDLDRDENLLNTPEGTFDLKKGLSGGKAHDSKDYITKMTTCAPGGKGKKYWEDALRLFFCGDQELIDYVQMVVGMAAIGKVYQEHLIIAYGGGANGKSTFWNTIFRVMGNYAGKLSAEALTMNCKRNVKPEMAELKGKRLIISSEMEEGMRLNTAIVKQLCSTDEIQGEKKYKAPFHFVPSHTLVLYTNHLPKVGANDDGIWRRLIVIPFNAKFTGSSDKKNYADFLYENAGPAIMSWIIEGAEKAIKAEFKTPLPECVEKAIEAYREDNDWLGQFIVDCCDVDPDYKEKSGDFYQSYRAYCIQSGEYIRSTTDFYNAVEKAGYTRHKHNTGSYVYGLKLREGQDFL